tara:strand:+ start:2134 stop:2871 length:738 start_codon:yes stop_codon:yes gene_type:complete
MDNVAFIMYSHSDYSDVWDIFFKQTDKHLPEWKSKYIFVDDLETYPVDIPSDYTVVKYDDSLPYQERVASCLSQIDEDICLFQHEDMFLYDPPDVQKLKEYTSILQKDGSDLDFIKLIKGGEYRDLQYLPYTDLYHIPYDSEYVFAVQPTLWRTKVLHSIYNECQGSNMWEFEVKGSQYCRDNNIVGSYCYRGEPQRGAMHWDSKTYPYIATAIVKGKWNLSEYQSELGFILNSNRVDLSARGTC